MNINPNISSMQNAMKGILENSQIQNKNNSDSSISKTVGADTQKSQFSDAVKSIEDILSEVDSVQQSSDVSIKDLLSGKNTDITSVVSEVAKADLSFKLLVGVRNKLIEAYKQTMNMPL
ncbi:MAG: flagellar hook-basal body complex protein FliE [Sedimentisphaerales bacterium]|nr:flagellar hook-basal body complex protein FliE [Sedimentisphaerales bacterium]